MPVAAFDGPWGWGYDGVDLYAVHHAYGGPAAFQRFVDACHDRGLGVGLDVVYNHLGPTGNYLGSSAPTSPTPTTPPGARPSTSTATAATRCAAGSSTTPRGGSATSTSTRCGSTPCTSSVTTPRAPHPRRALGRDRFSRRRIWAVRSTSSPSPTSTTRSMVTPTAEGGRGMTAQWDDDVHHAAPRGTDRRERGLLRRLRRRHGGVAAGRVAVGAREDADRRVPPRRPGLDLPRPRVGRQGRPRGAVGPSVRRLPADPRPGGQPRHR